MGVDSRKLLTVQLNKNATYEERKIQQGFKQGYAKGKYDGMKKSRSVAWLSKDLTALTQKEMRMLCDRLEYNIQKRLMEHLLRDTVNS